MPTSFESWTPERGAAVIAERRAGDGPLLPILHHVQETFGYVPEEATALIADALNLSRAEVHGVISFYHDFRREPPAPRIVRICVAEACQSMGATTSDAALRARYGVGWGETTADGVRFEPVYCLGLCATAPAALVDGRPLARLDEARLATALAKEASR